MDNAHTELSCQSMVATVRAVFPKLPPVALVVGMAADKDLHSISRALKGLAPRLVVCVALQGEALSSRGLPARDVASAFASPHGADATEAVGMQVCVANSMSDARDMVHEWLKHIQVVSGSLGPGGAEGRVNLTEGQTATPHSDGAPVVCVTGSNYIVGAAMDVFKVGA